MVGGILVKVAFAAALFASFSYFLSYRKKQPIWAVRARYGFHLAALGTVLSSALLLYFILTHQFQYTYVWSYSSTTLSTPLLAATFYAGQEGSFMLWALFTAIIGLALLQYSAKKGYEAEIMLVYALIQSFLLLMLIIKNPFEYVWQSFPNEVEVGFVPANGRGLNPLLQNYWMVIHPPILFVGFTAMSVPFAHAVAALLKRDYRHWIYVATPWTVFGVTVLGAGIMLGGFWAYETLGWGGYWGWDPVENSSLVPWLVGLASVHTMLSQRKSGTYVRTNFVLSLLAFLLVLYSTFLTRSGVLGDTSVHSFVEPGMWAYIVLLAGIFVFTFLGFGLFFSRMKEMPKVKVEHSMYSREFALFLGASALIICSVLILAGTSSPIITGLLQNKPSAVDISFYEKTALPIGIIIAILSGVGQLLWWGRSRKGSLERNLLIPFALAVITTLGLIAAGLRQAPVIVLTFAAAFTLFANLIVAYRIFKGNPLLGGGSAAHVGMALFLLGVVGTSYHSEKETISLERDRPVHSLGCTLKYVGYHPIDHERYAFHIEVEKRGERFLLSPIMYYSEFTKGIMRNPDIANFITNDFYLSPVSLENADGNEAKTITLKKEKSEEVDGYKITFIDYDFSDDEKARMLEGGQFSIAAKLKVEKGKEAKILSPKMISSGQGMSFEPATFQDLKVNIVRIQPSQEDASNSSVELAVETAGTKGAQPKPETLIVEASIKPYINVVWMGSFVILIGLLMTIVRRSREAKTRGYYRDS